MLKVRALLLWALTAIPLLWAAATSSPERVDWWQAGGYLAVFTGLLVLVRHRPVTALALALAAWQVSFFVHVEQDTTIAIFATAGGLAALGFLSGRNAEEERWGAVALVVAAVVVVLVAVVLGVGADTIVAGVAALGMLAVVPWSFGRYRRGFTELIGAAWERAAVLERDAAQARAQERARLAAEMHDLVGHELAHAALRVGVLEVDQTLTPAHREAVREARAAVTTAAEWLADVVRLLRSERESVEEVVERARSSGMRVELEVRGAATQDQVITRTIHRVVTEAVTNAMKHAAGAAVAVLLDHRGGGTEVRVSNGPGRPGAPRTTGGGRGLLGLNERVALVGGELTVRWPEDGGFELIARVPDRPASARPTEAMTQILRLRAQVRARLNTRRAVRVALGVTAAAALGVAGYQVYDAAGSTLSPDRFTRLRVGQSEAEAGALLPGRTRAETSGARRRGRCAASTARTRTRSTSNATTGTGHASATARWWPRTCSCTAREGGCGT
ncbi:sensor histidine kinase [Saccharothrix lopnurensis]|uniref:histidine kinase n=1 Tax=Saccharothrix lopnurensis TaxID=1670621 RepID=A0ABW1P7N2_9PSEU